MNSLFAKILLWFWATLVLFVVVAALISALTSDVPDRRFPLARLMTFELREARRAYETGGKPALQSFMDRLHAAYRGKAYLTDAASRDLLTGEDRTDFLRRARLRRRSQLWRPSEAVVMRVTPDGQYRFFFVIPPARVGPWFLQPEHWWVMALGVLLCYLLAMHLSAPVRQLQRAVERFGRGDLSARVNSERGDELGQLARTFDRMADRIQTLLTAERRLLQDISHELRSPLARLGVSIELARSGEDREAALNRIEKESARLNTLVGELLEITRVEGDPSAVRREAVRLDTLIEDLADACAIEAQARGCAMEVQGVEPFTLQGDPELLRRAIENVMRNAVRYAPPGTQIEVGLERRNGSAVVRVRDYGPGVPEESLGRIFDAFYRVDRDRNRESGGIGLGLAIARRAVELHGGKVAAFNANPGLRVEIVLKS